MALEGGLPGISAGGRSGASEGSGASGLAHGLAPPGAHAGQGPWRAGAT